MESKRVFEWLRWRCSGGGWEGFQRKTLELFGYQKYTKHPHLQLRLELSPVVFVPHLRIETSSQSFVELLESKMSSRGVPCGISFQMLEPTGGIWVESTKCGWNIWNPRILPSLSILTPHNWLIWGPKNTPNAGSNPSIGGSNDP